MPEDKPKPKVLLFLGAGASRPLGIPTSAEFFSDECYNRFGERDMFLRMAEHYQTEPEAVDMERLLSDSEMAGLFVEKGSAEFDGLPAAKLHRLGQEVKDRIYDVCAALKPEKCVEQYHVVIQNLRPGDFTSRLTIFTTNYDRAIETCFSYWRGDGYFGIREMTGRIPRLWDGLVRHPNGGLVWNKRAYDPPQSHIVETNWDIRLFKLHGSVGWVERDEQVYEVDSSTQKLLRASGDTKPLVVFPGLKGPPDNPVSRYARGRLLEELKLADWVIVIGFSFRDDYIAEIFQQAKDAGAPLRGYRVSPTKEWPPDSKAPKYREALGNLFPLVLKFGNIEREQHIQSFGLGPYDHIVPLISPPPDPPRSAGDVRQNSRKSGPGG